MVSGAQGFWSHEELTQNDAPLSPREETLQAPAANARRQDGQVPQKVLYAPKSSGAGVA